MSAYLIANITVKDAEKMAAYAAAAGPTLDPHGAEFIMEGHLAENLSGRWPVQGVALVRFPRIEAAHTWYNSADYQALRDLRSSAADMDIALFEAV